MTHPDHLVHKPTGEVYPYYWALKERGDMGTCLVLRRGGRVFRCNGVRALIPPFIVEMDPRDEEMENFVSGLLTFLDVVGDFPGPKAVEHLAAAGITIE
jgi:hypothetical protein